MRTALRVLLVVIGLGLAAATAVDVALSSRRYDGWLAANATELGEAQRAIERHERRRAAGRYAVMSSKVEHHDAEAAELAAPVVARLEGERAALFASLGAARTRLRYGLVVALTLFLVARAVPGRVSPTRW